jgi:DNA polymerase/3'-5' exonuclease PolX
VHSVVTICGSYRRGLPFSSDIDILISNPTINISNPLILREIKTMLERDPNYIIELSIGKERYTFLYRSSASNKVRQIDILNLPYFQYYPGILYFTGSWEFNERMRGYAKQHGFRLNQKGLFRITTRTSKSRGKTAKYIKKSSSAGPTQFTETLIVTNSEEEIFSALGLQYVAPENRNVSAIKETNK